MSGAMRRIGEYLGLLEDTGRYDDYDNDYRSHNNTNNTNNSNDSQTDPSA